LYILFIEHLAFLVMIHYTMCGMLILFFAWMLLHALIYSKSKVGSHYRIIEGLEPSPTPTPTPTVAAAAAAAPANPAEIEFLKQQVTTLEATAAKLKTAMTQNEAGVKNNTELVQKVVKSQNDTQAKMANMKSAQ
jgi:hypothetical protein